jgi:Protein of unknown function (DUF4231)
MASSGSDGGRRPSGEYWWQQLGRQDGRPLPPSVVERLTWYERRVRRRRIGHYAIELVILLASAAIPAAAAIGASTAAMGVLGAAVTALIGARQLFKLEEDWIRFSRTLIDLHTEAVAFSVGTPPYDDEGTAAATLATNVERLVAAETAQWSTLREQHERSSNDTPR